MRDAYYNVISVLGVRDAKGCEMRIFLGGCESLCPPLKVLSEDATLTRIFTGNEIDKQNDTFVTGKNH